jgi:hypothetical protein
MILESIWYFRERQMLGLERFRPAIALGWSKLLHSKRLRCRQNPGNQMFGLSSHGRNPYRPFSWVHAWPYSSTHDHVGRFQPALDKASSSIWFLHDPCVASATGRSRQIAPLSHTIWKMEVKRLFHSWPIVPTRRRSSCMYETVRSEDGTSDTAT